MSVHSVSVKRADEVVVGDWINWRGRAREVGDLARSHAMVYLRLELTPLNWQVIMRNPGDLVEVMDK